ncbi:hypothetical protein F5Y10DRAFT_11907 [Nemania abortiva]|nr:hypothetical protein F5Y10DRAFT_11907 [Nemania abortiva]
MELLRRAALSSYDDYENFDASSARELKIVSLNARSAESDTATYEIEDASEANVLNRVSASASVPRATKLGTRTEESETTTASLLLVSMWTGSKGNASEGVGISKTTFTSLVDVLDMDRSVLQPIVNNAYGLLEFSETGINGLERKNTSTYFLADSRIELLWSFNFATSTTKAILIIRRGIPGSQNQSYSHRVLPEFLASLSQQRTNIFNPYTLLSIFLVQMATWEAKSRAGRWNHVRVFEKKTGYGRYGHVALSAAEQNNNISSSMRSSMTLEDLTVTAKQIETLSASLASDERHMDILDSLLDALADQSSWRRRLGSGPVVDRRLRLCERDIGVFSAVIRPLRQRNASSRSALEYMAARTRSQSHVIFALRAQEESRINREIAESSRDQAEAAKRDTASMKTIAVMTMAFLPGTFFAALFSVPSLRWDQEYVVTDRFWVYWVFTLPVTAAVFLIWMVVSYDERFRTALDAYQRRKNMAKTALDDGA